MSHAYTYTLRKGVTCLLQARDLNFHFTEEEIVDLRGTCRRSLGLL